MQGKLNPFLLISFIAVTLIFFSASSSQAQTEEADIDAPQFLYRDGEHLVLVDAATGEAITLQGITLGENDRVTWSSAGQYLAIETLDTSETPYSRCLNVYDVDRLKMLYAEALDCNIEAFAFSHDGENLAFSTSAAEGRKAILWLHHLNNQSTTNVYETERENSIYPNEYGFSEIEWSLHDRHISFTSYFAIMGGTVNALYLLDPLTLSTRYVSTPNNGYYASYNPVWSTGDEWFLLTLQEEYVTSGVLAVTNHHGDLYIFNSETLEFTRLTYTPSTPEFLPHWTEDGQIAYTISQTLNITIDKALQIQAPALESIVQPEPIDPVRFFSPCRNSRSSPDARYVAETCPPQAETNAVTDALIIRFGDERTFGVSLPTEYNIDDIVIGWRPQN